MNANEMYGKLYEQFFKHVFDSGEIADGEGKTLAVKANPMMDLLEAEQRGNSIEEITELRKVVQDSLVTALEKLDQIQNNKQLQSRLFTSLIAKVNQAGSSTDLIHVLNETIAMMYLGMTYGKHRSNM